MRDDTKMAKHISLAISISYRWRPAPSLGHFIQAAFALITG